MISSRNMEMIAHSLAIRIWYPQDEVWPSEWQNCRPSSLWWIRISQGGNGNVWKIGCKSEKNVGPRKTIQYLKPQLSVVKSLLWILFVGYLIMYGCRPGPLSPSGCVVHVCKPCAGVFNATIDGCIWNGGTIDGYKLNRIDSTIDMIQLIEWGFQGPQVGGKKLSGNLNWQAGKSYLKKWCVHMRPCTTFPDWPDG